MYRPDTHCRICTAQHHVQTKLTNTETHTRTQELVVRRQRAKAAPGAGDLRAMELFMRAQHLRLLVPTGITACDTHHDTEVR